MSSKARTAAETNLFFFLKLVPSKLRQKAVVAYTVHSYIWGTEWDEIENTVRKKYFQEIYCVKNADVFGTSQGGMIAQYLAIDRPDLVRRLVLAVTLSRNNDTVKQVVGDWIEMAERGDMKRFVLDMAEKMYSETYVKKYRPLMPLLTILQKPKDVKRRVLLAMSCLT